MHYREFISVCVAGKTDKMNEIVFSQDRDTLSLGEKKYIALQKYLNGRFLSVGF